MNKSDVISDLEKELGIEADWNEDFDTLCDGDTCRHSECQCWDDLESDVRRHLEEKLEKKRLRGSLTVHQLREILRDAKCGLDDPVFINDEPIWEAWGSGNEFLITTRAEVTV
jgi:hypothetical protein